MSDDNTLDFYEGDELVTLKSLMSRMDEIEDDWVESGDNFGVEWYDAWQVLRNDIKNKLLED